MSSGWMDEFLGEDAIEPEETEDFYCPYTNSSECALITKGWQPQELCYDINCDQLKYVAHNERRRDEAA